MNRRKFLKQGLTGVAGAGAVTACGGGSESAAPAVHTNKSVVWRLASSFPPGLDTIYGAAEYLAQRVEAMSEGRFRIRCYPAGEIVPPLQVMDAAQQGTVQIAHTASYYYIGKSPALAFDACVPFGLTSRQQTAWLTQGGGLELMREVLADFQLTTYPAGNTGSQMGGWFRREIGGPEELKGLRMRIPGLGGEVMDRLGATVQLLAGGEIYPALERGAIDATEWVGPYDDEKLGFHNVAEYYYYPGWWEPGPSLSYQVNRAALDKLPSAYREMFITAASESATYMQARYDHLNPTALVRLLEAGVQIRPFSDDLMRAAREISFEMLEEQAAADSTYNKIYTSWNKARRETYGWFNTAELAYARFAFGET